jgi:hypothetical protein
VDAVGRTLAVLLFGTGLLLAVVKAQGCANGAHGDALRPEPEPRNEASMREAPPAVAPAPAPSTVAIPAPPPPTPPPVPSQPTAAELAAQPDLFPATKSSGFLIEPNEAAHQPQQQQRNRVP